VDPAEDSRSRSTTGRKGIMPKASRTSASESVELEGYEGHLERFEGGYTVAFERYTADADLAEFFKGLPDDKCQAPHWGYVIAGKVTFTTASGEETFEAGDAYYVPPGHTPRLYANTEVVEFSPSEQLQQTLDVVSRNMEAAG
jgi:Cupin domain